MNKRNIVNALNRNRCNLTGAQNLKLDVVMQLLRAELYTDAINMLDKLALDMGLTEVSSLFRLLAGEIEGLEA